MAILKCKMCGGDLDFRPGVTVAECEYCGTLQTIPNADSEKKMTLFARANRLRAACEFDTASAIYEQIIAEFPNEAEAYWGLVLCKFGIEYVDDPVTGKKIPTCHRTSFDSVLTDVNFDLAVANTDMIARKVYRQEAEQLEKIRQGILSVSSSEAPYDIFICYKETDSHGDRTVDSVIAQNIYDVLTDKGYRVFFSRISLEDKLGQAYEPYIFAALNSAKIMLAVGTSFENYNAVWVKNEWSRFLKIISQDKSKYLFPCYKNIDPYDMPREFAHLQGQDMGKVGAMQDLIRGIEKHLPRVTHQPIRETIVRERVVVQEMPMDPTTAALVSRGKMALEDRAWAKADRFFEEALNRDAECAQAYVGKVLAQEKCTTLQSMAAQHLNACIQAEEQKALINEKTDKFLGDVLSKTAELAGVLSAEAGDKAAEFSDMAKRYLVSSNVIQKVSLPLNTDRTQRAIRLYRLPHYLDVETIREMYAYDLSYSSKEEFRKQQRAAEEAFWTTNKNMNRATRFAEGTFAEELAFVKRDLLAKLDQRIAQAAEESRSAREKAKAAYAEFLDRTDKMVEQLYKDQLIRREEDYLTLIRTGETETDSPTLMRVAEALMEMGEFKEARTYAAKFRKKGADAREEEAMEADRARYYEAQERERKKKKKKRNSRIRAAVILVTFLTICVLAVKSTEKDYQNAENLLAEGKYDEAAAAFEALGEFDDSADKAKEAAYLRAQELLNAKDYDAAIDALVSLGDYKDGLKKLEEARYWKQFGPAEDLLSQGKTAEAAMAFYKLGNKQRSFELWDQVAQRPTIDAGFAANAGLRSDGSVAGKGQSDSISEWTDIVQISNSLWNGRSKYNLHTVGLKSNGTVVAAGDNEYGQCDISTWTDIVKISVGSEHTVGLRADGTVLAVGKNNYHQYQIEVNQWPVNQWSNIVDISAGSEHVVGLKSDGTVVAVGYNGQGQCNVSQWTDIVAVSAGGYHTVGLKSDGTVVATEFTGDIKYYDGECEVETWTDIVAISAGERHTVGLKSDGTVIAIGENYDGQCNVDAWTDIVAISAGTWHTIGLKSDGTVVRTMKNAQKSVSYYVEELTEIALPGELTMTALEQNGLTVSTAMVGPLTVVNESAAFVGNIENP